MSIKRKMFSFWKKFEGVVWDQWKIMERWKRPQEMLWKRLSVKSSR